MCKFQSVKPETINSIACGDYQMIGYCSDEEDRLERLTETHQSVLVTLGIEEKNVFDIR